LTDWKKLIIFCNSVGVGNIVTRKGIFKEFGIYGNHDITIEKYAHNLRKNGFLKTVKPGQYQLIKPIPDLIKIGCKTFHKSEMDKLIESLNKAVKKNREKLKCQTHF